MQFWQTTYFVVVFDEYWFYSRTHYSISNDGLKVAWQMYRLSSIQHNSENQIFVSTTTSTMFEWTSLWCRTIIRIVLFHHRHGNKEQKNEFDFLAVNSLFLYKFLCFEKWSKPYLCCSCVIADIYGKNAQTVHRSVAWYLFDLKMFSKVLPREQTEQISKTVFSTKRKIHTEKLWLSVWEIKWASSKFMLSILTWNMLSKSSIQSEINPWTVNSFRRHSHQTDNGESLEKRISGAKLEFRWSFCTIG